MAPVVTDIQTAVPPSDLAVLEAHLPYSYSLLRRCQFTHRPQGHSPHAHYLFASDPATAPPPPPPPPHHHDAPGARHSRHFAAAYVDLSKGPETEVFFYSTLQDHAAEGDGTDEDAAGEGGKALPLASLPEEEVDHVLDLIISLFRRIKEIAAAVGYTLHRPHGTMVGGLHEGTYQLLVQRRGLRSSYWNPHDVWLFRLDRLPAAAADAAAASAPLPSALMRWDVVWREDVPLMASRTKIPKVEATLMSEPSVVVRKRDAEGDGETLIAWGFMGIAGTLSTLHVEVSLLPCYDWEQARFDIGWYGHMHEYRPRFANHWVCFGETGTV